MYHCKGRQHGCCRRLSAGWYRFYYKSDEIKTFIISCCLKSLAINNLNIPKTIEGLNLYFNHKFRMSIYDNNKVLLGYHGDEFEFNFIFKQVS